MARPRSFFSRLMKKILAPFYYSKKYIIVAGDLTRLSFRYDELGKSIICDRLSDEDLGDVRNKFGDRKYGKFKLWLSKAVCFVPRDESGIIGYVWYTGQSMPNEGERPFFFNVNPPSGAAYIFDGYMPRNKRNYFIVVRVLSTLLNDAKVKGFKMAFATTDHRNRFTRLLYSKLGFKEVGQISYSRILFFSRTNVDDLNHLQLF